MLCFWSSLLGLTVGYILRWCSDLCALGSISFFLSFWYLDLYVLGDVASII